MAFKYMSGARLLTQTGLYTFGSCLPEGTTKDTPDSSDSISPMSKYVDAVGAIDVKALIAAGVARSLITLSNGYTLKFIWDGAGSTNTGMYWYDSYGNRVTPSPGYPAAPNHARILSIKYYIGTFENNGVKCYSAFNIINWNNVTLYWMGSEHPNTVGTTYSFINAAIPPDDPYGTIDNHTPEGGYGGFNYDGDDVDIPALPTISAAASGFVRLYNPNIGEVQSLASYLWSGAFDLATYKKLFGNPMDCFLSFGIIPVTPPRSANKEAISFANMPDPGVTAYKLTSQFAEFDCGSVTINSSKYTSSAMDYSPYTKAELFLPFCGTHSLSVDDIMDGTIAIKYHMDLYTGACVAYVKITRTNSDGSTLDSVLYQFTGNILATIPLTGADHSNFIQSMLFMGAAVAATVATAGGAAPEIGGAMAVGDSVSTSALGGAAISASGINAVMSMKPNVIRSGNLSANAGFLGLKKPVITLTCPNLCRPDDENKLAGMPCQKSGTLSDFSGFNIVGACHLDNIPCTMEELRMIDTALAKGVIV